jgi:site-specific recombinase XerD
MPRRLSDGQEIRSFLQDPDINRWYQNMGRGSMTTADSSARSLRHFCLASKNDPKSLLKLDEDRIHALILDYISSEQNRGIAGSTTRTRIAAVKSWLSFHGIRVTRSIKIKGAQFNPSIAEERTPTQDELRHIFHTCKPRARVAAALMAFSGLRPEVIAHYRGEDGLRVGDITDLEIQGTNIGFTHVPALVLVRPELSKARHRYFTFLGEEGCEYLKEYLEARVRRGEILTPRSGIIRPEAGDETLRGKQPFMWTFNVSALIRHGMREAGLSWRPYVLRAYFDTQLLLAESKGKVAHDYRVFWMGHKGSMEARYTTNKGRLPKELIEDMRQSYSRCEPFLSTIPTKGAQDTQANIAKVMLLGLGYSDEDLADKDLLDPQVFQQLVKDKMTSAAPRQKQKLVEASELPQYLDEGWTVVTALNGHQVVLNPPGQ